jgi:uncharacterized protein GlcG (DUF336 family)
MSKFLIEQLESRCLLSGNLSLNVFAEKPVPRLDQALSPAQVRTILGQAIASSIGRGTGTEVAVVVDREGTVLGALASNGALDYDTTHSGLSGTSTSISLLALANARTAAFFESSGEAFTTRTARFIIQNHFPQNIQNTAGGPLYGVEFSDLINSDILVASQTPGVSGNPGGIPLYIKGVPVGAIGVAGDFHDIAATPQLVTLDQQLPGYDADPKGSVFTGPHEEMDFDEAVAQAGAVGFAAPQFLRATNIFVAGLRFPFVAEPASFPKPGTPKTFQGLISAGDASELNAGAGFTPLAAGTPDPIIAGQPEMENATIGGVTGLIRDRGATVQSSIAGQPADPSAVPAGSATVPNNPSPVPVSMGGTTITSLAAGDTPVEHSDPQGSDAFVAGIPADSSQPVSDSNPALSIQDVINIIGQAEDESTIVRAGIRKPNGVPAEIHVVVVDIHGNVLGAFRGNDGTNFSYDVAAQKARTAAFFSDDTHAFSATAIGFMSQKFFPAGIEEQQQGPLFLLQNELNQALAPIPSAPGASLATIIANALAPLTLSSVLSGPFDGVAGNPAVGIPFPVAGLPGGFTLGNGITIFPGGFPLYKDGHLVGGIGVSGDGVNQDDLMSFTGANGYEAPEQIRADSLGAASITNFIISKITDLTNAFASTPSAPLNTFSLTKARQLLTSGLADVRLPYARFPRNPLVNH